MTTFVLDSLFENFNKLHLDGTTVRGLARDTGSTSQPANSNDADKQPHEIACRKQHHELRIHYPALDLIVHEDAPENIYAVYHPAHGVQYRKKPQRDLFHLDQYPPDFPEGELEGDALSLLNNINRLGQEADATFLSLLPYTTQDLDDHCPTVYWFRQNTYYGHGYGFDSVEAAAVEQGLQEDYCLMERDFYKLLRSGASWIPLLEDLFTRKSDQACLYVQAGLETGGFYDPDYALLWDGPWNTRYARPALTIFKARIDHIINDLNCGEDDMAQLKLPSGYWTDYDAEEIKNATVKDLESACCQDCNALVLTDEDQNELVWWRKLTGRQTYGDHEVSGKELDKLGVGHVTLFLDKLTLLRALLQAGVSLRLPRSAVPKQLSLADCEETTTAFLAIRQYIDQHEWPLATFSDSLYEHLKEVVAKRLLEMAEPNNVIVIPSPPGWEVFLLKWLRRAVAFLVHRACDENGWQHRRMHWHDDDAHVYYAAPRGTVMSVAARAMQFGVPALDDSFDDLSTSDDAIDVEMEDL